MPVGRLVEETFCLGHELRLTVPIQVDPDELKHSVSFREAGWSVILCSSCLPRS